MGLDGVELVMAVEEEFKIAIPDSDAFEADTVGKLVDAVHSRLRQNVEEPCPSQQGFYLLRKELMTELGLARSAVKPDSELDNLIPKAGRRHLWRDFVHSVTGGENISTALVRPRPLNWAVVLVLPCVAFLATLKWVPGSLFWLGFFPALAVLFLADRVTTPFKTCFPSKFSRVRDLVPFVRTLDSKVWSRDEVFQKIREITVEILGVKPEQVKMESHWVNDLGVG
jgi:acyl carrier protein